MNITELLITAYDGDQVVFTSDLTPELATTVMTSTNADGETAVEAVSRQETSVFNTLVPILRELATAAACART